MTEERVERHLAATLELRAAEVQSREPDTALLRSLGRRRRRQRSGVVAAVVLASALSAPVGIYAHERLSDRVVQVASDTPVGRECPEVAIDVATDSGQLPKRSVGLLGTKCQIRVVSGEGEAYQGSLSSTGDEIAFVRPDTRGAAIVVWSRNTGQSEQVYAPAELVGDVNWSPDGKQLAFWQEQDGKTVICILDIETSAVTVVSDPARIGTRPIWSVNGELAFLQGQRRIAVFDSKDGQDRGLPLDFPVTRFDWSPDGAQMVVLDTSRDQLAVVDSQSGETVRRAPKREFAEEIVLDLGWAGDQILISTTPVEQRRILITEINAKKLDSMSSNEVAGEPNLHD